MAQAQQVDVSTVISRELRELIRHSAIIQPVARHLPSPQADLKLSLRRDGQRPMRFVGCLLFHAAQEWTKGHIAFDHRLSVYADDRRKVIAALSLCPKFNTPLRPSHWARDIPDQHSFERMVDEWCRNVLVGNLGFHHPADLQDTRATLHSLTSHSLRVAKPHTERKEPCLL